MHLYLWRFDLMMLNYFYFQSIFSFCCVFFFFEGFRECQIWMAMQVRHIPWYIVQIFYIFSCINTNPTPFLFFAKGVLKYSWRIMHLHCSLVGADPTQAPMTGICYWYKPIRISHAFGHSDRHMIQFKVLIISLSTLC